MPPFGLLRQVRPGTKVLFANVPADGHFNPLTPLAKHLKDIGCDVRWYTSKVYAQKVNRMGIQLYPLVKALDVHDGITDDLFPDRVNHRRQVSKLIFDMIQVFIYRAPEYFEDVKDIYQEFPFELMIADMTFGAIPMVREKLRIPVIGIGIMPLSGTSKDLPPSGLGLTPSKSLLGRPKQAMLRFAANKLVFNKPNQVLRKVMAENGIDTLGANVFDYFTNAPTLLLQSGTPSFEYHRTDLGKNIRFVGPLLPDIKRKEVKGWYDQKVKQYKNVLLVTQGTIEKNYSKLIVPTLEAFKNTDTLVIATTGGNGTEALKENYPEDNIIIEDFIPFNEVMPYAHAFITNGGYGGVLAAIQHKLPMVVAGVHECKLEINARIGFFQLGLNLKTEKPSSSKIRKGVEKVLTEDSFKRNVHRLAREFSQYDPGRLCAHYAAEVLNQQKTQYRLAAAI